MRILSLTCVAVACLAGAPASTARADAGIIELTFDAQGFHPDRAAAEAGKILRFRVRSEVSEPFNFEIEQLHLSRLVRPGKTIEAFSLIAPSAGSYRFIAEFQGMDEDKSPGGVVEAQ